MTIKERAEAIKWDLHAFRVRLLNTDELGVIEQHITAAVEDEREACAKVADDLRDTFKAEIVERARDEDADKLIADYAGATGTAEMISKRIRARSAEKEVKK